MKKFLKNFFGPMIGITVIVCLLNLLWIAAIIALIVFVVKTCL